MSYVKIHREIVNSSIWSQPHHVRVVWITLLALADQDGLVPGSPAGLCRLCAVTREEFDSAMTVLTSEDPDSGSPECGGRRVVVENDGGRNVYRIVTYDYYRRLRDIDDKREKDAARQARQRAKRDSHTASRSVTPSHDESRHVTPCPQSHDKASDLILSDLKGKVVAKDLSGCGASSSADNDHDGATAEVDDEGRETACPVDLARRLPASVVPELAAAHRVTEDAIRRAIDETVTYWTVGAGAGRRRKSWPRVIRQRIHELAKRGELATPAAGPPIALRGGAVQRTGESVVAKYRAEQAAKAAGGAV